MDGKSRSSEGSFWAFSELVVLLLKPEQLGKLCDQEKLPQCLRVFVFLIPGLGRALYINFDEVHVAHVERKPKKKRDLTCKNLFVFVANFCAHTSFRLLFIDAAVAVFNLGRCHTLQNLELPRWVLTFQTVCTGARHGPTHARVRGREL
jgi:hypothetical protein